MSKNWSLASPIKESLIKKYPQYSRVVLQLLANRGITEEKDIEAFLNPQYDQLHDPFLFEAMDEATDLIIKHIKQGNKIAIYGDYDADGVTSSAVLFDTLSTLKARLEVYIPERASEGYGINNGAIDYLKKQDVKLMITVDTGIRNIKEVEYAKEQGIEVIVTDHHPLPENRDEIPKCPVIDPADKESKYPFSYLAGVGVAFKVAKAVISKAKLTDKQKDILEKRLLDLVATGTIADMVKLFGENRILTKKGLEVLNKTKRVGFIELIKSSGIVGKKIDTWNVGFQIGPRINAAGRMDHANGAFMLLIEKDVEKAKVLADDLTKKNIERQEVTLSIVGEVEKQAEKQKENKIILGVCPEDSEKWHEGIVGLVAGRVNNKYYKPTLVITRTETGFKGSGRSVEDFDMAKALEDCSELLEKHGGHPMACGFSCSKEKFPEFQKKITKIANEKLKDVKLAPTIKIDQEIKQEEINEKLLEEIDLFSPFGQENPTPIFATKKIVINDIMTMGTEAQHIKFRFGSIWAIAFGQAEAWKNFKIGDTVDICYEVEMNEFNGNRNLQLKLVDIKIT